MWLGSDVDQTPWLSWQTSPRRQASRLFSYLERAFRQADLVDVLYRSTDSSGMGFNPLESAWSRRGKMVEVFVCFPCAVCRWSSMCCLSPLSLVLRTWRNCKMRSICQQAGWAYSNEIVDVSLFNLGSPKTRNSFTIMVEVCISMRVDMRGSDSCYLRMKKKAEPWSLWPSLFDLKSPHVPTTEYITVPYI